MRRKGLIGVAAASAVLLSGCGTSVYGPRRLIYAGYIDGSQPEVQDGAARPCPTDSIIPTTADLTLNFTNRACTSLRSTTDPSAANMMMQAGITLTRMRCADFFAQRGGNQGRARILRGAVLPVSALLTGLIALKNFKTDEGRIEATQILGLGQTATIAGLELFESEFLFGSANVNSVRLLTMRALNRHAEEILKTNVGFDAAARHLIDHQMICTPANILALAQEAIRTSQIEAATPLNPSRQPAVARDQQMIATMSSNLHVDTLTADQLGAMWWLEQLPMPRSGTDQDVLAVIHNRLALLPLNPVQGTAGYFTVDDSVVNLFSASLQTFSPDIRNGFIVTRTLLAQKISAAAPLDVLERTKDIHFQLPTTAVAPTSGSIEVGVPGGPGGG